MKMNIEIDIDWLEEDGSIDEEIKHQVINRISKKIDTQTLDKIKASALALATKSINEKVEEKVGEIITNLLNGKISVTDKWGEIVKSHVTIESIVKDKLDKSLMERVDNRGLATSHSSIGTRLDFVVSEKVRFELDKRIGEHTKQVDAAVKKYGDELVTKKIAAGVARIVENAA